MTLNTFKGHTSNNQCSDFERELNATNCLISGLMQSPGISNLLNFSRNLIPAYCDCLYTLFYSDSDCFQHNVKYPPKLGR